MVSMTGTYQHERSENLDEYFKAVGVPYIPRKMMCMTNPKLEISKEGEKWTVKSITMMRTMELTFNLEEEFEETMPSGDVLKNVAVMEGDNLIITSTLPDGVGKVIRKYEFKEDEVTLTMTHQQSGQVGKRYFKRLS